MRTLIVGSEEKSVCVPHHQRSRLDTQHFRGVDQKYAGNFAAWNTFLEFLNDPETQKLLGEEVSIICEDEGGSGDYRINLKYSRNVGWESTLEVGDLKAGDDAHAHQRMIGKNACAKFFEQGYIDAPATKWVTLSVTLNNGKIFVQTIYPGVDIGRLNGDLTTKKGLYFFDFNNPGE